MDEDEGPQEPSEPTHQVPPSQSTQQVPPAGPAVPPMPGQPQVVYVPQPTAGNGLATAALVCGIVGLVMFWTVWLGLILGVLAIVFGAIGRSKAAQGAPNKGQATAGLWLGIAAVVVSILVIGLFTTYVTSHEGPILEQIERCMENPDDC